MKQNITRIVCDQCRITREQIDGMIGGFNPFKGWHHVHINSNLGYDDKLDFCSEECVTEFFAKKTLDKSQE